MNYKPVAAIIKHSPCTTTFPTLLKCPQHVKCQIAPSAGSSTVELQHSLLLHLSTALAP